MKRYFILVLVTVLAAVSPAGAQEWPNRPVRVVVPQSAGSASDIVSRVVMGAVASALGQPFVTENRVGAGNTIAMAAVARAEPDGYTILVNSATHSLVPVTYQNLSFDTFRDLQPLLPLGNSPMVMMVNPAKGYTSVADFVTRAKAAKGSISYSGGGIGSIPHLAAEAFRLAAGFDGVNVPFKGAPEALNEVLAGRLDFYFSPLPPALPLLQANQLQALAVTGSSRSSSLPNVPTVAEAGYTAATYNFWIGVFVPAKTPPEIANRLYMEIKKALDLPDTKARLATLGVDPMPLDQAEFQALIEKEFATNSRIAKAVGLQPH